MRIVSCLTLVLLFGYGLPAYAHSERGVEFPSGNGHVPKYRTSGRALVVCNDSSRAAIAALTGDLKAYNERLLKRCRFGNVQDAIDAVETNATRILILPGTYFEKPSLGSEGNACKSFEHRAQDDDVSNDVMTYEEQVQCPHAQNLVAILGDGGDENIECDAPLCGLQIEGTGGSPEDVVLDAQFKKLNVLRSDRADGAYFKNFTVQHSRFNGLYVIQQDGFVIDDLVGRWNDEYGFLTFASDHGVYKNCEAHGNGDSGLYPGGLPSFHGARHSIEIKDCVSHHNALGLSATGGDSLYVHDSTFRNNSVGVSMDSFFGGHPGVPQNSSVFVRNRIHSNNVNYYRYWDDGTCAKPSGQRGYERGVVCPVFAFPVGTGIFTAGGSGNVYGENYIYDNWRYGTMLFWVPASARGELDPAKEFDTSHFNRYPRNVMGLTPSSEPKPNGLDFWWDEEGAGNCWESNVGGADGISSDPATLPGCEQPPVFGIINLEKQGQIFPCTAWSPANVHPAGCDWTQTPVKPQ